MSIFTKIQTYFNTRFDNRVERSLKRMNDQLSFNPKFNDLTVKYMTSQRRSRLLTEYLVWYMGDPFLIEYFYNNEKTPIIDNTTADMNMFWKVAPDALVKVHSGLPGLLSNKKSRILWGNGVNIEVEVYDKKDGKLTENLNEEESKRIRTMLVDTLLPQINFFDKMKQQTEDDSWSGHTALKFSFDKSITPYPIIETADARLFTVKKERGFTTAIVFHEWFTNDRTKKTYRMDEIYTTVRNKKELEYYRQWNLTENGSLEIGDAVILYVLHVEENGKDIELKFASWSDCPELTSKYVDNEGSPYEAIAFAKLKGMLAFEKPNRLPNGDFPGSHYGGSDYSRSIQLFDKVDELVSEDSREVRDNKAIQFWPPEWMDKSDEGKIVGRNKFKTNYLKSTSGDVDQTQGKAADPTGAIEVNDKTSSHVQKFRIQVGLICANAHISPTSLGGIANGFESKQASEESQLEREKDTVDTRNEMINKWEPYLQNTLLKLLEFTSWLLEFKLVEKQSILEDMDIDFENCKVRVKFPDYTKETDSALITTWGSAKTQGVADTETCVSMIYKDLPKNRQKDIVDRIKFEQGMVSDNPNNLSLVDLTNNENEDEEGGEDE